MPRPKSDILSGVGTGFEVIKALSNEVQSLGGSDDDLRRIISGDGVAGQVAELLVTRQEVQGFDLFVDYSRPLAEVMAAGPYNYTSPIITEENFPTDKGDPEVVGNPTGVQVTQAVLLHYGRITESDDVLVKLGRRGLRPGTMFELAHFGEQHLKESQLPIVALGSVWLDSDGTRRVGCLCEGLDGLGIELSWFDNTWLSYDRFLAFSK